MGLRTLLEADNWKLSCIMCAPFKNIVYLCVCVWEWARHGLCVKVRRQPHKFSVPSTSLQQGLLFSVSIPGSLIHKTLGNSLVSGLTLGVLGVLRLQIHVYPCLALHGSKFKFSHLCSKHFSDWAISPVQMCSSNCSSHILSFLRCRL